MITATTLEKGKGNILKYFSRLESMDSLILKQLLSDCLFVVNIQQCPLFPLFQWVG
jgi:hypothetical protein